MAHSLSITEQLLVEAPSGSCLTDIVAVARLWGSLESCTAVANRRFGPIGNLIGNRPAGFHPGFQPAPHNECALPQFG
jgi:hypothetical protein